MRQVSDLLLLNNLPGCEVYVKAQLCQCLSEDDLHVKLALGLQSCSHGWVNNDENNFFGLFDE
jgi:hypothetical protein